MIGSSNITEMPQFKLSDGNVFQLDVYPENTDWVVEFTRILGIALNDKNQTYATCHMNKLVYNVDNKLRLSEMLDTNPINWECSANGIVRKYKNLEHSDNIYEMYIPNGKDNNASSYYINMWRALFPIYYKSMCRGGLPVHSALAEYNGQGILFAGPGNTGKSTCSNRLPKPWNSLCDDETLIVANPKKSTAFRAHPFPTWSEYIFKRSKKTWNVQNSIPIAAIFFLKKAGNDRVTAINDTRAPAYLFEISTQVCDKFWISCDINMKRKFRTQLFENAYSIAKIIPTYLLEVSPEGCFWEIIEKTICHQKGVE